MLAFETPLLFSTRWHCKQVCDVPLANHHILSSDPTPCLPELVLPDALGSTQEPVAEWGHVGLAFVSIRVASGPGKEIPGDGTLRGSWDNFLLSTIPLISLKFLSASFPVSSLPPAVELPP